MSRMQIAVFSGPTATIANSPDLVTSNQARSRHGFPPLADPDGRPRRFDVLRPQRLAAPVTVYIEAYSAHPLEGDAADLSVPPDGWLDADGHLHPEPAPDTVPAWIAELRPDDGLYLLPYMARQADGAPWEQAATGPMAPFDRARQTFYPDAARIYEEIDRFGLDDYGHPVSLSSIADFHFVRAAPPAGYTKGNADIPPERPGQDYFAYYPYHLQREPSLAHLATATNIVQDTLATGAYGGGQWLEGSPTIEETMYWLGLVVDTTVPLVGHAGQRRHQALSADGDRNIVDGVKYLTSQVALDEQGRDRIGPVVIIDEVVFAAREVTKVDARPGGYEVAGGHGGIVADMGGYGPPQLTYIPTRKHTWCSDLRLTALPSSVAGVTGSLGEGIHSVDIATKTGPGRLRAEAMPVVTITKYSHYAHTAVAAHERPDPACEVEILARIGANLAGAPLAGFVAEGMSPFAMADPTTNAALAVAVFAGMPVVRVGRGNTGGLAYKTDPVFVAGSNLTATKARMLLMAAMLRLGSLPPAADPWRPTIAEVEATRAAVARYQDIFDTH